MKKFIGFIILLSFISCKEIEYREMQFVILEKQVLNDDTFYLRSKDTVLSVHPNDYMRYEIGDTLVFNIPKEGFFRGSLYLKK